MKLMDPEVASELFLYINKLGSTSNELLGV